MRAILTLAAKDILQLWRNKFGLFWVLVFPLLMALFFGSIFSGGGSGAGSMKIAMATTAAPNAQAFLTELRKSSVLNIQEMPLDSARSLVARGKLTAYIQYVQGDSGASVFSGSDSIRVGIDPSRKAEAEYLRGLISQAYFQRLQQQIMDPKQARPQIARMLRTSDTANWSNNSAKALYGQFLLSLDTFMATIDTSGTGKTDSTAAKKGFGAINLQFSDVANAAVGPRSSWEITFPQSLLWALIGCATTFALSLVMERTRGTYLRLRLAPLNRLQVLAGKGLACFVTCTLVCSALMLFGAAVFHVRVGSHLFLALAIVSAAFCFVGIMMLISVLGRNERTVGGAGWAIMLVLSMTGGGMVPLMFMPSWIAGVSTFSPLRWCVLAFEGAIWRGFGFAEMLPALVILWSIGAVGLVTSSLVLRRMER